MYVEGKPVEGMEVFRNRRRGRACLWVVAGCVMLLIWTSAMIRMRADGRLESLNNQVGVFIGLTLGSGFVVWGLFQMFVVESLLVDRARRVLTWTRESPLGRKAGTVPFDEIRSIHIRRLERSVTRKKWTDHHVIIESGNHPPIDLGASSYSEEAQALLDRIRELTGEGRG